MAYTRRGFKGAVRATSLSGAINDSVTTIGGADLSTWSGITTNGPGTATISRGLSDEEQIEFTGVSGGNLTGVTRGAHGSTGQAHASGATLEHTSSKTDYDEANAHLADTTLDHHTQYARTDGTRTITGQETISRSTAGLSLRITKEAATFQAGSISIERSAAASPVSIRFQSAVDDDFIIGVPASTDDLTFQTFKSAVLTERMRLKDTGELRVVGPVKVGGDVVGEAGYTTISNVQGIGDGAATNLQAPAKGTGSGPTSLTAVAWAKIYIGTSQVWVPAFQ